MTPTRSVRPAKELQRRGHHVVAVVPHQEHRLFEIGRVDAVIRVQAADAFLPRAWLMPRLRLAPVRPTCSAG